MRVGDLLGPCVHCSSQTFGKRDKHIGNSCPPPLLVLHRPATSPSPSRCPCSAACSSFLPACLCFFLFRRLLYVALRAAGLPAFGRCPLFSVFVPRWQPRHQSSPAPPSAFHHCLPVGHVHLQACLCSFLFGSLVWDVLPSALRPSFGSSPVLCCVFVPRWPPKHRRWHVLFFLPLPSARLLPALQLPAVPLCWCFPGEWGTASSCYRLGHRYKNDVAPAKIQKRTLLALPCRGALEKGSAAPGR